jgi:serine/threonine-protein kinase
LGRLDEEPAAELEIARRLTLASIIREGIAFVHMLNRQYDQAIAIYREMQEDDPSFYKGYTSLGRVYAQQGNYPDAIRMLEKGRALAGDIPNILGAMGQVYALGGERQRARDILAKLAQLATRAYVPSTVFAVVHLGLGETNQALMAEQACDQQERPSLPSAHLI